MIDALISLAFLAQVVRIAIPYALAAVGGAVSERAGVIALALEGELLVGAFAATVGAYATGSAWVGVAAGLGGGAAVAALYGAVVLRTRGDARDQIVAGVAINLLALGLTRFLLKRVFDSAASSPRVPGLASQILAEPLLWMCAATAVLVHLLMTRTAFGLRARAVGEHPQAARSAGVSVVNVRWAAVTLCGGLAGLGGAWLSLGNDGFAAEMSGGRGYVALAAVIMGKWRPVAAALACLAFAVAEAVQVQLQASAGGGLPPEIAGALPYALAIVAVCGLIGRSRAPGALGRW